jgi:hypothetical protein
LTKGRKADKEVVLASMADKDDAAANRSVRAQQQPHQLYPRILFVAGRTP